MRYTFLFIIALLALSSAIAPAQLNVSVNFNVQRQPIWGPTGYDYVDYYYLPDIETYYSVSQERFYYYEGGRWVGRSRLPSQYSNYDIYNSYKVVVNERRPYRNHKVYRDRYSSYRGRHDQQPIRDSRDERYFAIKNHPEHNKWVKNGRGNGKGKGNRRN